MSPKSPEIARFQAGGDWEGREGERKEGGKRDDAGTFREVSGAKIAPFSPTLSPLLGGNAERGARRGGEGAGGGPEKNPPPRRNKRARGGFSRRKGFFIFFSFVIRGPMSRYSTLFRGTGRSLGN